MLLLHRLNLSATLIPAALAAEACGDRPSLPPYGEVVYVVDTDVPVPQIAGRLRVDLFGEDGRWLDSRDIARPNPTDWPASFSVYIENELPTKRGVLRLRAYPEGKTRDYRGERYQPFPIATAPFMPSTLDDICLNAPLLTIGQSVTVRRGMHSLAAPIAQGDCIPERVQYTTGTRVHIDQPGFYRFGLQETVPPDAISPSDTQMFLRRDCQDPSSQVGCDNDGQGGGTKLSRLDISLEPGEYVLFLTGNKADRFSSFTVRAALVDQWDVPPTTHEQPRLLRDGRDITPQEEPQPSLTIDRLVPVTLHAEQREQASIVLHGACLGTMAHLPQSSDPSSLTCIDSQGQIVDATTSFLDERKDSDSSNNPFDTFADQQKCQASSESEDVRCVPGGHLVLGDPMGSLNHSFVGTTPERVALVSRFWMDRREVTVGKFRQALSQGLPAPDPDQLTHNPLKLGTSGNQILRTCTWSNEPMSGDTTREDYALSCVSWRAARSYCRFMGGDLPTEAQWEYAACAAGRPHKTPYPWGGSDNDAPTCATAVFARLASDDIRGAPYPTGSGFGVGIGMLLPYGSECREAGSCPSEPTGVCPFGPLSNTVAEAMAPGDITPNGILGLGGGLAEFALDDLQPYDSECWRAAPLVDPMCWSEIAPLRAVRGGSWGFSGAQMRAGQRLGAIETVPNYWIGFRCTYPEPLKASS